MSRFFRQPKPDEAATDSKVAGQPSEGAPPQTESMFAEIQNAIRNWESRPAPNRGGAAMRGEVARKIAPFLGPRASAHILSGVSGNGEDLLSTIEPVLALFLGNRAASRLVDRIVDSVLVRS